MKIQIVPQEEIHKFMEEMIDAYQVIYEYRFGKSEAQYMGKETILSTFTHHHCLNFEVVDDEGHRLGGAILSLTKHGKRADLFYMYTLTEYQNEGIATFLWKELRALLPGTKNWYIDIPLFNAPAIHFFINKCGFRAFSFSNSLNNRDGNPIKFKVDDPWTDGVFFLAKRGR